MYEHFSSVGVLQLPKLHAYTFTWRERERCRCYNIVLIVPITFPMGMKRALYEVSYDATKCTNVDGACVSLKITNVLQ